MNWQIIIASDLFSDYLKITDLLNFLSLIFYMGMLQVFRIEILKFSILEILKGVLASVPTHGFSLNFAY